MIAVKHLNFTYAGNREPAIKDINFTIERGEIFGFLGPSGAGKSTTQKILIGWLKGYQGQITVMGRDLSTWGSDYYEQVGVSFEQPNHFLKLTARENLEYFRSLYSGPTEDPQTLLEWVGLREEADKRVGQFSKGMRGRLTVARSLLHKPKLLFLDEPTSGLDPVNAQRIQALIQQRRDEGTTIFLTTHNMAVADALCHRVAFITEGRIQLIDTPRELKLRYGKRLVRVEHTSNNMMQISDFPLDDLGSDPTFLALLRSRSIQTIHTQETTLEKIFIDVTGRVLK